jgi:Tfp pilus assembly protein PilW
MLNRSTKSFNQKGLTLIEMLIALVLGLFVTAVIISVFATNVRSSNESIRMVRLNQELRGVMTLMTDELKRAGYSADTNVSSFMADLNFTSTCARYSYDEDGDGVRDLNERFGFRLNANKVQWANNATGTGCTGGTWNSLTTLDIASITTLDFDISGSANVGGVSGVTALTTSLGISVYDVAITLTGVTDLPHSTAANDPRRTVIENIRIRNDDPKD